MRVVSFSNGTVTSEVEGRKAEKLAALMKARSSKRCADEILGYASEADQRNAAIGATIDGDHTAAEIAAFIEARRAEHAARKAAIQAILDDTSLDNAGKLAALDAL